MRSSPLERVCMCVGERERERGEQNVRKSSIG